MFRLLVLGFAFTQVVARLEINAAVDEVLLNLKNTILDIGLNQIPIGNVFYHWKYHLTPGTMGCHKGWASSLGSLHRIADVEVATKKKTGTLTIPLSLESLEYGYEQCEIKVIHLISWHSHARASVATNSLKALVTMRRDGDVCTTTLDAIQFTNIGKITITTGGKIAHRMQLKLAQQLNGLIKDVEKRINDKFQVIGSLVFRNSSLCSIVH